MADTEAIRGLLQDGDKVIIPYVNPATKTNEGIVKVDDALSSTSENPVQNKVINTALSGKQATLVSGTNIKTVNNTSVLGSGNIAVQPVISDLADIRSNATAGKSASDTISGYGDVVTHDADEFMPADTVIPVVNNANLTIQKNGVAVDTFTANASADKIINITVPTKASDVSALPSSTKYGASLSMSINSTTYVLTAQMKDQDGNNLGTAQTVDLPIESLVMDVDFDEDTNELVIKLQSGTTTRVPIGSIIGGLQSEINANNKLDADFIEDTLTTKKLVTTAEKNAWNGKQDALSSTQISNIAKGGTALQPSDVDSALSTTSENPVQNKVITSALPDTNQLSYYGTCSTAAATQAKVVVCEGFELKEGVSIRVKFTNAQSYNGQATLNVNSTGAKGIVTNGTTKAVRYCWLAGEVVSFTYDGANWVMEDAGIASTSYYGYTKLLTSATSTNAASSLTPAGLNSLVQNMIEPYPVYSTSATYAVGDRVRYSYQAWECITAITTAEAWTAAHWKALDPIQTQIDDKQDTLVSGTNIKTINGNSLLGSGNIEIQGGADVEAYTSTEVQTLWGSI